MGKSRLRLKQRFLFFLERQLIKGAKYQLLFVAVLIGLLTILGGFLVLALSATESVNSPGEALWWAFLRLTDPGYLGDDMGVWQRLISTVLTIAGSVIFVGALVAIMTQWLNSKMRQLEQGLTPVAAENHIVILGWNNRTLPVIGEILSSSNRLKRFLKRFGSRKLQLVVMADDVTSERVQELKDDDAIGQRYKDITMRSGDPLDVEHLERVDASNASAIIIPSRTTEPGLSVSADVETFKILLSLNDQATKNTEQRLPYVVAEIQDKRKKAIATQAYSGPLELIAGDTIISRLVAQNIRQEGLSEVYKELLTLHLNNNIFIRELPDIEGKTMAAMQASLPKAIVLGIVRKEDNNFIPHLNLSGKYTFSKDDRLVLLAREYEHTEAEAIAADWDQESAQKGNSQVTDPMVRSTSTKVLILGWNHHIPTLINEFNTYEKEHYQVDTVSIISSEARENILKQHDGSFKQVQCRHLTLDYTNENELRSIKPAQYDNIILASSDRMNDDEEADARTIAGFLLLDHILADQEGRPQILLELFDPDNESLIDRYNSEVIISPLLLSRLMAQIALRQELHAIFNELFTVGGAEIIFRAPHEYQLSNGTYRFSELEQRAMTQNETALGIYRNKHDSNGELLMNPPRDTELTIDQDVQLVILTSY
jgi:hypothetical protein